VKSKYVQFTELTAPMSL